MTDLTPGMTISVGSVLVKSVAGDTPAGLDSAWYPYTGPGSRRLYAYTGRPPGGTGRTGYPDTALCNECVTDPAKCERVIRRVVRALHTSDGGALVLQDSGSNSYWRCDHCSAAADQ